MVKGQFYDIIRQGFSQGRLKDTTKAISISLPAHQEKVPRFVNKKNCVEDIPWYQFGCRDSAVKQRSKKSYVKKKQPRVSQKLAVRNLTSIL